MGNKKYTEIKNEILFLKGLVVLLIFAVIIISARHEVMIDQLYNSLGDARIEAQQNTYKEVAHMSDVIGDAFDIQVERTTAKINTLNSSIEKLDSKVEAYNARVFMSFLVQWVSDLSNSELTRLTAALNNNGIASSTMCNPENFATPENSGYFFNKTTIFMYNPLLTIRIDRSGSVECQV